MRVDGGQEPGDVQDVGGGGGGLRRGVQAVRQEGFDVRHPEEGGGGGGEEDDGVWTTGVRGWWFLGREGFGEGDEGCGVWGLGQGFGGAGAGEECFGDFADVGEILLGGGGLSVERRGAANRGGRGE